MEQLADKLSCGPHLLSLVDRELIATYVSAANDCVYCQMVHGAIAAYHMGGDEQIVAQVKDDFRTAPISGRLKALLTIADRVQRGGKKVRVTDINRARRQGASDLEIHDTVLIATMFCTCTGRWLDSRRSRKRRKNTKAPSQQS
jgi:uncharacterized peroxidase-related enzyme